MFAGGVSRYGVADAVALATDTHDFESRYLDGLVGPYPEAADVYGERAPINHVDGLSAPVLLLQGLDDPSCRPRSRGCSGTRCSPSGIPHALIEFQGEGHGFRGRRRASCPRGGPVLLRPGARLHVAGRPRLELIATGRVGLGDGPAELEGWTNDRTRTDDHQ